MTAQSNWPMPSGMRVQSPLPINSGITKQCVKCGEIKSDALFDKTRKGNLTGACHECRREWRKKHKERIRRMQGAVPRENIAEASRIKAAIKSEMLEAKRLHMVKTEMEFVGPRKPGRWLGEAVFYAWRITNDPVFYAKELDRAQAYKARTRAGYKHSVIGWAHMSPDVIASKHLMYLISKHLKRSEGNEKH